MPTLDWIGKQAVLQYHHNLPCPRLKLDAALSAGSSANLLVEGDNLLALKGLLPEYGGRVKCIYLDPPYNTGAEHWVYNDNVSSPEIAGWLHQVVGKAADDQGRHDKWLCMMCPRLALVKEFLTPDGVLFISIDDHEVHALRFLMNEFPDLHFLGCIVWERKRKGSHLSRSLTQKTEYILAYSRTTEVELFGAPAGVDEDFPLVKRTNRPKTLVIPAEALEPTTLPDGTYPVGSYGHSGTAVELLEPVEIVRGRFLGAVKLRGRFVWKQAKLDEELQAGGRCFLRTMNFSLRALKAPDKQGFKALSSLLTKEAGTNEDASAELSAILGGEVGQRFTFPKPHRLIQTLLAAATHKQQDAIVLDAFAGSGTTGHAVLALNKVDGGARSFVLVEGSEAICRNVTQPRLARVIGGYQTKGRWVEGLGGGFRYATLEAR